MKPNINYLAFFCVALISMTMAPQHPSFEQYPAYLFKGHKAPVIINSNPRARMFKTVITDIYYSKSSMKNWHGSTGLNFAGHYCFAYWGCGSPCDQAVIADVKTGIIYDAPAATSGYEFKLNSRLVIVNPRDPGAACAGCTTEYWVWNDQAKKFKKMH